MGKTWDSLPLSTKIGKTLFEPRAEGMMNSDDAQAVKNKAEDEQMKSKQELSQEMQAEVDAKGKKHGGKVKKKQVKADGKKSRPRLDRKRAK